MKGKKQVSGYITGKDGNPIEGATVYLKDASFNDVLLLNEVSEYGGKGRLKAYLMQVSLPEGFDPRQDNCLKVEITDRNTLATGQASLYFRIA